jgi:L-2-hydroxyglutarate oxidase LhgO
MSDQLDCVVVGAGVVGLAVGRSLALAGREVVVLECEPDIGMHTSSRNSEVIHAGIYYGDDTLKARLCVQGKEMLYRYCEERHVPFQRIGKLIVAAHDNEISRLRAIQSQASRNGVNDLELIDQAEVRKLEPAVDCKLGLLSPSTGIIDSHSLMVSLRADIEAHGGSVLTHSRVSEVRIVETGFELKVDEIEDSFHCTTLVNSAGLHASEFAHSIRRLDPAVIPETKLAKAHYFAYQGKSPFNHLVYPLPEDGGLGVHATNDMGGSARFGPDVCWVDDIDYSFDESRVGLFVDAIRQYFPALDENRLTPAYTGIRPKLSGPGDPAADFQIQGDAVHRIKNLVNLFGIESPGLTASLAIGEFVNEMLD